MFSGYNGRVSATDPKLLAVDLQHSVDRTDPAAAGFGDGPTYVMSPDGRQMAVPGENYGRLRIIDLPTMRIVKQVVILHGRWRPEATMLAWPTPNRIIAAAQRYAAHVVYPSRLLVIDLRHRTVRATPLHGTFLTSFALDRRRTAVVVAPAHRVGTARIVIVDGRGRMRSIALPEISAGYEERELSASTEPAVLARKHVAYFVGEGDRVATVDLRNGRVESHAVTGWPAAQPSGEPFTPGSGGLLEQHYYEGHLAGPHRVFLSEYEAHATSDGRNQLYSRPGVLVDTRTWQVVRLFYNATGAWWSRGLLYVATDLAKDPDHFGPSKLTAYDGKGGVVFTRLVRRGSWQVSRGHLIEQHSPGGPYELNPLTGRPMHGIGTIAAPFELIHWRWRVRRVR